MSKEKRRLLEALIDHAQNRARLSITSAGSGIDFVTNYILPDAAEARFLIQRQDRERR